LRSVGRVFILVVVCWHLRAAAQRHTGELRLSVVDPQQAGLAASVLLVGEATRVNEFLELPGDGRHTFRGLPFGEYVLRIQHPGFAARDEQIEIRSQVPLSRSVQLGLAPVATVILVEEARAVDPYQLAPSQRIERESIRKEPAAIPGRALLNLVMSQPGWLLEANGVLHPRGSEYDTQYVVDGFPIQDNRSPAFAPALETENIQNVTVMTGGFPAEYGKKMGGVVEVTTTADRTPGLRLSSVLQRGSFNTGSGFLAGQFASGRTSFRATAEAFLTDRYLDPPVEENFTNHSAGTGFTVSIERDVTDHDRVRLSISRRRTNFDVPNELIQQLAGQRQRRRGGETVGQLAYDHVFSSSLLASVRVMSRDVSSALDSNALSTPIIADQYRGFRETYIGSSLSAHVGHHEIKSGVELNFSSVRENFAYQITAFELGGFRLFDGDPPKLDFQGERPGQEQSAFVQDTFHSGRLTISAGIRYDRYQLLTHEEAFSPRLGVSWQVPSAKLLLHAAYDRMFSTPAIENLLISGAPEVRVLFPEATYIPLRPARGNSVQAGVTAHPIDRVRIGVTHFRRTANSYGDDELFLNTGVSFPVAFEHATVSGTEARIEVPKWGRFSGVLSYTNMTGTAQLPIAGGLLLDGVEDDDEGRFPISQDQRNTARARIGFQATRKIWAAIGVSYGSGLPVEIEEERPREFYVAQYGEDVVDQVNFDSGRVRPNFSFDASMVAQLWRRDSRSVSLQADALNLTNRLNVINFSGLFSGTAIGSPRSFGAKLRLEF
jgi:outer membrane cobalamin receptor